MSAQGSYEDHCRRENLVYLLAYEEWENSLSPEERALLGRAAAPDIEDHRARGTKREVTGALGDAAERAAASYSPILAGEIDTDAERIAEIADIPLAKAKIIHVCLRRRTKPGGLRKRHYKVVSGLWWF